MGEFAELIRDAYDSFNRGEVDAIVDLLHPDVDWIPPATSLDPTPLHGREAVRGYLTPNFFETQTAEPHEVIEEGDRVLVAARIRARGRESGIELDETAYHVLTIEDGRVVRFEVHMERAEALAALRDG
jgi:ketosteroid isomerase-like protein